MAEAARLEKLLADARAAGLVAERVIWDSSANIPLLRSVEVGTWLGATNISLLRSRHGSLDISLRAHAFSGLARVAAIDTA
jgi:hypothetical protein